MQNLIALCVRRPVTVLMMMAALLLAGIFSLSVLPLERLPELRYPQVTVETGYPGMSAAYVRSTLTIPVEDALSTVKGLEGLKTISRDGSSVAVLDFRWGMDSGGAASLVREAVDGVYPSLPEGINKPMVFSGGPLEEAHAIVAIKSRSGDGVFARSLAEYELRARFRRLDGVGAVILAGGEKAEARVKLDLSRSIAQGINPPDLAQVLAHETMDIPAGNAREGDLELVVVSSGRPSSVEELSHILLPAASGALRLSDLAVTQKEKAKRKSLFIYKEEEMTALEIYRRPGADPVKLSRDIKKVLAETETLFSHDAEITLVWDSSGSIVQGIRDLGISSFLAAAAVVACLLFFMGRLRYSILTSISIPLSSAAALCALALGGRSLNGMSLGGLALGIGLVSDTAVITADLLHRHYNDVQTIQPDHIGATVASVSISSFAGTLTTAIVFIPILFLPGPLGSLYGDLSIALVTSITAGWLYAQFGLPSLFVFFQNPDVKISGVQQIQQRNLEKRYGAYLRAGMRKPVRIILGAAFFSAAGLLLLLSRPAVFISPETVSEIEVLVKFPALTLLENAQARGVEVSKVLSSLPCVETYFGKMGAEDEDVSKRGDPDYRREDLLFRCMLRKGIPAEKALQTIRMSLADLAEEAAAGETFITVSYPKDRTEKLLGLSSGLSLALRKESREELLPALASAEETLKTAAGSALTAVNLRPSGKRPEYRIIPDREAAAFLGISAAQLAGTVYAASEGIVTGTLEIEGRALDVRVNTDLPPLEILPLAIAGGDTGESSPVFLGSVSSIVRENSEAVLARQDRGDVIYLDMIPAAGVEKKLAQSVRQVLKSEGLGLSRADESVFSRYRASLLTTVILVLLLLYLCLGAQFESFSLPCILMLSIPFSLAGAGPALFMKGGGLDSGSVLGLVVLFGLAVNNGIVLYEVSEEKFSGGLAPVIAVYTGALERIRPVIITTLTTIFALAPLVFSPLGTSQRSMAAAMLGGIVSSTALCLFALPPVFIRFLKKRGHP